PIDPTVSYYIFLAHEGWQGTAADIIEQNFETLAEKIGPNSVLVAGFKSNPAPIADEILARYFGAKHAELRLQLPAIVVTKCHPNDLTDESFRLFFPLHLVEEHFKNGVAQFLDRL